MEEIAKRVGEAGAGLVAAAKGVATQNFVANQSAHRRRVEDSHRLGMKTLGMTDDDFSKPEDENVGDVIVTGDVYGDEAVRMLKSTPKPDRPVRASPVLPFLLGGLFGTIVVIGGAFILTSLMGPEEEAAAPIDTDTQYLLELVPGDSP